MTSLDLHVSPLGRVEGDLDVRVTITDGVVTSAWTEAAMFRGFEIIPRRRIAYREQALEEMDLDAILARRPALTPIASARTPR